MNLWHFSEKARNMMTGLFVWLGANHYGAFFAHFLFILVGLFLFTKNKINKIVLFGVIALTIRCVIYTFSRGAYLAVLAGLFFMGLVKDKRILILLFVFLIFWRSLVPVAVVERIDMTRNEQGELEDSAAQRIVLWNIAWNMFKESPIIGKGFDTFQIHTEADTHNMYMKILAEMGVMGLLAFLFLLYQAFFVGWRLYKAAKDNFFKSLGLGFCTCVLSLMITNAFGDRWTYLSMASYFWIFLGMVASARLITASVPASAVEKK